MSPANAIITQTIDGVDISSKPYLANGRYEVESILAAGGQGAQIVARDQHLVGNRVLIKVQLYPLEALNKGRDIFLQERKLRHDALFQEITIVSSLNERLLNMPRLVDYFYDDNATLYGRYVLPGDLGEWEIKPGDDTAEDIFVVYEFLGRGKAPAQTLRQLLNQKGKLTEEFTLSMARQVLDILWQLHEWETDDSGKPFFYIYEDIKPENILVLGEQDCFLIDFGGITVWMDGSTPDPNKIHTKGYAPPEFFDDPEHLDHRFDIFSLGVTMFQCLTGIHPTQFLNPNSFSPTLNYSLLHNLGLRPLTVQIIKEATHPNRHLRFRSAKEMMREIDRVLGG